MEERPYASAWDRPGTEAGPEADRPRVPWEAAGGSLPVRLFRTWMEVMTNPVDFFDRVDQGAPFSRPLLFYLVITVVATALASMTSLAVMGDAYVEAMAMEGLNVSMGTWHTLWFFLSPFVALVSLALYTLLVHLGVRLFVRGGRATGVTARGICYSAAPSVLYIVPFLGAVIATVWSTYLAIVAVWRMHGTSAGRASAAVLVPLLGVFLALVMATVAFVVFLVALAGVA